MCEACLTADREPRAPKAADTRPAVQPCARCGHEVLVRCGFMDRAPKHYEAEMPRALPLAVAFEPLVIKPLFGQERSSPGQHDFARPVGVLEGYFCRACGKVEWFVRDPGAVPLGSEYGTELVDLRGKAPYR